MKIYQQSLSSNSEWNRIELRFIPDLFLLFISPQYANPKGLVNILQDNFPDAIISGCSTAGEIIDVYVQDKSVSLTAIKFECSRVRSAAFAIDFPGQSFTSGQDLARRLLSDDLRHMFVFSDGLHVNGAELVNGLTSVIPEGVSITGGLAGDGAAFNHTFVVDQSSIKENLIVGIGLYGDQLKLGFGSQGGWDSFGIDREVTRSEGNVLFELDGKPALALYKSYLGEKASELPASGLLFPLNMRVNGEELPVVRTILAVDEKTQSLTFAGNIPEGAYVRLMKANIDRLINGAENSAEISKKIIQGVSELAILISCVGRRLVLKQLVEEEIAAVREVLGNKTIITGFYSYGELAPFGAFKSCQLHNQTMTITTIREEK
jgi:hypothetical protein